MSDNEFVFKHTVYLNETNAVGGCVYFANYVKWQGFVREAFFVQTFSAWIDIMKEVSQGNINMITVEEHSKFKHHSFFGDTIIIKLHTANVRRCSLDLTFKMYRNSLEELVYEGSQTLTFADKSGEFITIPEPMRQILLSFQESSDGKKNGAEEKVFQK